MSTRTILLFLTALLICSFPLHAEDTVPFQPPDYTRGIHLFSNSLTNYETMTFGVVMASFWDLDVRATIALSSDYNETEHHDFQDYTIPDDMYNLEAITNNTSANISLVVLRSIASYDRLELYGGLGPCAEEELLTDEYSEPSGYADGDLRIHRVESRYTRVGAEALFGGRWWVAENIAIQSEYTLQYFFQASEVTTRINDITTEYKNILVNKQKSNTNRLDLSTVRVGISFYF